MGNSVFAGAPGPAGPSVQVTEVASDVSTTTTSNTDALVDSMTITPGAGDYVVNFTSSWKNSGANDLHLAIYVGESKVGKSKRKTKMESSITNTELAIATNAVVEEVEAGEAIEIRWRTTGGTATMLERSLIIQKI